MVIAENFQLAFSLTVIPNRSLETGIWYFVWR